MNYDEPHEYDEPDDYRPMDDISSEERTWAMFCHLSMFSGHFIPFGNILGPLIIWLVKRDEMPLVDDQGKEALNFQISIMLYLIISILLIFVIIGIVLVLAVAIFNIVVTIMAAIKANEGYEYRYPLCIRFIS
ncbi:MAG: DUF4870 domain-containing protein [Planctomycetaceae bacterium]|jgi:uncharacterized protein|nr:DUF4870 domain-containing protein [Planctomycetaceae bacterium]MBT6157523.1 DUF4870 domain-containing protein [Planctomycetaceae bacterium]MBT6488075.1 DUF4870 domain-containing protein [Planctomycetaceae bacterium]MBT6493783.1 DUF4870 domain-containing protein [Planctomycetaceae bacterium]